MTCLQLNVVLLIFEHQQFRQVSGLSVHSPTYLPDSKYTSVYKNVKGDSIKSFAKVEISS